ncbi:MAG: hypothetical protein WCT10_04465 [Patescibacteria group bacterium]|jgi:N-acyl-L-homoserine lactone synthetase
MQNKSQQLVVLEISLPDAIDVLVRWNITDIVNGIPAVFTAEAGIPLSAEAKLAMYHLRYLEFAWRQPENHFPDQTESDRFDVHADHFIARLGSNVLGSMRLIPCEKGFPMEDEHEVLLPDGTPWVFPSVHPRTGVPVSRDETVEISRLCGRPHELPSGDYLWTAFLVIDTALNTFLLNKKERKYAVAVMNVRMFDLFTKLGYGWIPLAPPQEFRGLQVQAAWLDMKHLACPRILPKNR